MISQPLKSSFPWNVSPLQSELINGTVGDLGSGENRKLMKPRRLILEPQNKLC